ncbi:MAG: acyl-ACP--UDP-N-acetylglucosamine O-acyltransferase [Vicinamibacteria bacterium]|nr:acyl-ACP--UDP-N-acetylglucosamine O-acyltransferase [Vicinamibacteria bacterium]
MGIHPNAVVSSSARLGNGVRVGPFAVIEDGVGIGDGCEIRSHAVVKRYTRLGPGNVIHEHAVIGGEAQDLKFSGGRSGLTIGARNVFREGVTIHRSNREDGATIVGDDCFLMAFAHVAHDCVLRDRVIIANNSVMGGHVEIASQAFVSGCVGIHQFCRVGRLAMIAGGSTLRQDALPFMLAAGYSARPCGVNVVGLRRAGFGAADLMTLKEALRLLTRSALPRAEALDRVRALRHALADEIVDFVQSSKRGIPRAARGLDG